MNRCKGLGINKKVCRKIIYHDIHFCCDAHKPINYDLVDYPCIICSNLFTYNDIKVLKCNHAFHKECLNDYYESLTCSKNNFEESIELTCPLCKESLKSINKKIHKRKNKIFIDSELTHLYFGIN